MIRESIEIQAPPERVFPYFTDPELLVRWMGDYAVLDARPGGEFTVDIGGVPIRGEYLEIDPPSRVVLSWGHAGSDTLPPGASRLEVTISGTASSTVEIVHSGLPGPEQDGFRRGWRHYAARLRVAAAGGDPGADPGM